MKKNIKKMYGACVEAGRVVFELESEKFKNWVRVMAFVKLFVLAVGLWNDTCETIENPIRTCSADELVQELKDYLDAHEALFGKKDKENTTVVTICNFFASVVEFVVLFDLYVTVVTFQHSFVWIYGYSAHHRIRDSLDFKWTLFFLQKRELPSSLLL